MLAATDSWRLKELQVLSLSTSTIIRKTEIPDAHNEVISAFVLSHPIYQYSEVSPRRVKAKAIQAGSCVLFLIGLPGLDILPGSRCWLLTW